MVRHTCQILLIMLLTSSLPLNHCSARGFGGLDRSDGGGFSGGAGDRTDLDADRTDESADRDRSESNYGVAGSVDRSEIDNNRGLPSDGGANHVNYTNASNDYPRSNDYNVNRGAVAGPYGGYAAGGSVSGPNGNTAYRGGAVGPYGGTEAVRGADGTYGGNVEKGVARGPDGGVAAGESVTGPDGNTAYRGAAVGPNGGTAATRGYDGAYGVDTRKSAVVGPYGNVAAGTAVRGPDGGYAAGRAYSGRYGAGVDYAATTPAGRYAAGAAIRRNFNGWGYYRSGWYGLHPDAWYAAGWAEDSAWRWANWDAISSWMAYQQIAPVFYDYGNTITFENNNVYMNGVSVATANQYYNMAKELAMTGVNAQVSGNDQWMPLGVFALSQSNSQQSEITLQIAVNKEGIIRGNDTNDPTNQTHILKGAVDRNTQRAAFIEGTDYNDVFDIGLCNLTKDEAPILLHFGPGKTETWLLTRLQQPSAGSNAPPSGN